MKNIIDVLEKRGFIEAMTSDDIAALATQPLKVYLGFDPTADSLHIGNLVGIMALAWFQKFGHTPVAVVGGATGMIGDPSGKSVERNLLDQETIEKNLRGITCSLEAVLDFSHATAKPLILNNHEWYKQFDLIEFLRKVGKHFRLGTMLAKEAVRNRLESDEGLSFTEFSYQLLQAYDFLYLYDHHQVIVQLGGSDQWGNITAGTELIRKMRGKTVFGLTFPLLTRSDGKKFGKSEEGTIWLNPDKLSPYEFYQYLFRIPDADVGKLMRMLTFMELEEIEAIERSMKETSYIPNTAQKILSEEVTRIIHGKKGLLQAIKVTNAAAPGTKTVLDIATLEALQKEIPSMTLPFTEIVGQSVVHLFVKAGFLPSKSEIKRLIRGGGIYLNNEKIAHEDVKVDESELLDGRFLLLGVGKKKKMLVALERQL
ncbi:MAG: tyrosine--tRNA ligase [Chlamydiia bacterium]|nr:tyrosine--tRNA ligase [Chlamydiia bacterium]